MALTEQRGPLESLSLPERSKKAHAAITQLATNLVGMPEFLGALGKNFFERASSEDAGNLPKKVEFVVNGERYIVNYRGVRKSGGVSHLSLVVAHNSVYGSTLELASEFSRERYGDVQEFINGHIMIGDGVSRYEQNTQAAFDKIPHLFPDLFPSVVKF